MAQRTRIHQLPGGNYCKYITIGEYNYRIEIKQEHWVKNKTKVQNNIDYWKKCALKGDIRPFEYGTITKVDGDDTQLCKFKCDLCDKTFNHSGNFSRHRKTCIIKHDKHNEKDKYVYNNEEHNNDIDITTNIRDYAQSSHNTTNTTNNHSHNTTNNTTNNDSYNTINNPINHFHINNFGFENPRWLNADVLRRGLLDYEYKFLFHRMLKQKHFNDKFPDNKNIRVCKDDEKVHKRINIFEENKWRVKRLAYIVDELYYTLYGELDEFLNLENLPEPKDDDVDENQESDDTIDNETYRKREYKKFINYPFWKRFKETTLKMLQEYMHTIHNDKTELQKFQDDLLEELQILLLNEEE